VTKANHTKELYADEIVGPTREGFKRWSSARITFNQRILKIEKISSSLLARAPRSRRVKTLIPGLVDPHTHMVFAGDRSREWEARLRGETYQSIAKKGGGIAVTVTSTKKETPQNLEKIAVSRIQEWFNYGCTSLEMKSGYGLDLASELKTLKVIQSLKKKLPLQIFSTFMGAHKIPKGQSESDYIDCIVEEMLPQVAPLADFQDIFCEQGYFGEATGERLLDAGLRLGLKAKVHAHEFGRTGGVNLAVRKKAVSADHLQYLNRADILKLKKAKVVPVVLSGTSFFLGAKKFAPAREMLDAGLPVALASDFNPGTNPGMNLPLVGTLAAIHQKLSLEEALTGQTRNAAKALGLEDRGAFEPGYRADFAVLDAQGFETIYYHYGKSWVERVFIGGQEFQTPIRF